MVSQTILISWAPRLSFTEISEDPPSVGLIKPAFKPCFPVAAPLPLNQSIETSFNHISTIYQLYINHISTIYQPYINYISTIYQPSINYISTINHISTIYQPYINHISTIYQPSTIYQLYINHISTIYIYISTINHISTIYQPSTIYQLYINHISTIYQLYINHQPYINYISTINHISTIYQPSTIYSHIFTIYQDSITPFSTFRTTFPFATAQPLPLPRRHPGHELVQQPGGNAFDAGGTAWSPGDFWHGHVRGLPFEIAGIEVVSNIPLKHTIVA